MDFLLLTFFGPQKYKKVNKVAGQTSFFPYNYNQFPLPHRGSEEVNVTSVG